MDSLSCIYVITNTINNKQYVGQTCDYNQRVQSHLYVLNRGISDCKHLQNAFNKYGSEAFRFDVLEPCAVEDLDEKEKYWIQQLDTFHHGYNMTEGGGGLRGYKLSSEHIEKIRTANTGRLVSDEARRKMSESHPDMSGTNNPCYGQSWATRLTDEKQAYVKHILSIKNGGVNNPNYGKVMSDEQKKKLSESHKRHFSLYGNPLKGRARPERSGLNSTSKQDVVLLNTREHFPLVKYGAEKYHVEASSISSNIHHDNLSAGKDENGMRLVWVTEEEYARLSEEEIEARIKNANIHHGNQRGVHCITTDEYFSQMKDACLKYSIDPSGLSSACRGKIHTCGTLPGTGTRLEWEYTNLD